MQKSVLERQKLLALVAMAALAGASCKAQMRARASVDPMLGDPDAEDRKYETPEAPAPATSAPALAAAPAPRKAAAPVTAEADGRTLFLGVVHDLSLASGASREAVCRCLAVGYGTPSDPKFAWQADAPRVDPETFAVAITSEGVACASPGAASQRASISAVEREGADLVVIVENAREGQPVMHGALATSPGPRGSIVVRARNGAPYGTPASGGPGPCRIAMQ